MEKKQINSGKSIQRTIVDLARLQHIYIFTHSQCRICDVSYSNIETTLRRKSSEADQFDTDIVLIQKKLTFKHE